MRKMKLEDLNVETFNMEGIVGEVRGMSYDDPPTQVGALTCESCNTARDYHTCWIGCMYTNPPYNTCQRGCP